MSQRQFNIMLRRIPDLKREDQENSKESATLVSESENEDYCFMKTSEEFKFILNSTSSGKATATTDEVNMTIKACMKDRSQTSYPHNV